MDSKKESKARGSRTGQIRNTLLTVLLCNTVISVAKIIIGSLTGAASVRADGIHSIFDGLGNLAGVIGITFASRPADSDHPYGHGKFETTASLVIGLMLLVAAFEVGSDAINTLFFGGELASSVSPLSFAIMLITLVVNIALTSFERYMGKKLDSSVLGADSKHTLSDALVTISVLVGLAFVQLGYPIADPICTLIVAVAIVVTAVEVLKDVNNTFSDVARIDPDKIRLSAMEVSGVVQCHNIRTRGLENEVYADMHILVDPEMTILRAHEVAEQVETKIKMRFKQVREVMIHLEPATADELECPLLRNGLAPDPYGRKE